MRTFVAVLAGLMVGTLGTLAYTHYLEEQPPQAQDDLDSARKNLASANEKNQDLKSEVDAMSAQIQQLSATNDDLKNQGGHSTNATTATSPPINPMIFAGMMRGGFQTQQRLLLLKSRLHLSPEQEAAVKTAMEADAKQRQDMMRQMFRGGKADPQAAAPNANTLDQTLAGILSPEQQATYKQVQTDEKTSQANTSATAQVNQVAPLLQLSDSQKDQVFNALYQVQIGAPDPVSLIGNPNAQTIMAAQTQATQDALAKILTPDQMALYQQQVQAMTRFGGRGNRGGGGAPPAGTPPPGGP